MQSPQPPASDDASPHPSEIKDLSRRLEFLALDENDREQLQKMTPRLNSRGAAFVEMFYRHLFSFEETARFLGDPVLVERLKRAQQAHLESMLAADWNDEYMERRYRVGDAHAQVGISPQIFLGAYNQYLQFCLNDLSVDLEGPGREFAEKLRSLQKVVFLDIGLTLEAYFRQATQSLRKALDLVYQANSELRQFAQLTSHDLKTPLATMANLCDEALDEFREDMPAEAASLIEAARQKAFRMSNTIDELLRSTISLHSEAPRDLVDTAQVIAEAVDQMRPLITQKKIELVLAEKFPRVLGDRTRIREVFYNLLSNAVKFSDKRHGRIEITFSQRECECIVSIADNGPGIPAEELERIFVPFRRLPNHREIPGSGLGLYFAKTMIEQQEGRIWIESEVGAGSCFHVLLKTPSGEPPIESESIE